MNVRLDTTVVRVSEPRTMNGEAARIAESTSEPNAPRTSTNQEEEGPPPLSASFQDMLVQQMQEASSPIRTYGRTPRSVNLPISDATSDDLVNTDNSGPPEYSNYESEQEEEFE